MFRSAEKTALCEISVPDNVRGDTDRCSMILWASQAFDFAQANADRLVAIEFHGEDVCRVVLEGDPGVDPELGAPDKVWTPELPEGLREINRKLSEILLPDGRKKWPDMSPFWVHTVALCYFANRRNQIFRVGRRGGKSSTMCRIAVYECLYGDHRVPGGDTGIFAIISALVSQAKDRIKTVSQLCDDLGVDIKETQYEIQFVGRDRSIRCYAATTQAVVSFTSIGAICDEEALWRDDEGNSPAAEVLGNLRPTLATMPNAKIWHISAPWSTLDVHYEAFERGLQADQVAFYAPTWIANPTLTEAGTHIEEPDEPTWERQYAAIPSASDESKFFNAALIDQAVAISFGHLEGALACGADLAFRKDSAACVIVCGSDEWIRVVKDRDWVPGRLPLRPTEVIKEIAAEAIGHGCDSVCTDLHYVESVREETDLQEIGLTEFPTAPDRIAKAYIRLRVMISRGKVDLSRASVKLIRQLKETTCAFSASGMSIKNPRTVAGHGDTVSAFVAGTYSLGSVGPGKVSTVKRRIESARHVSHSQGWSEFAPED